MMRRTLILIPLVLILVGTACYGWLVEGWFSPGGPTGPVGPVDLPGNAKASTDEMERLAREDPVGLIEESLRQHKANVHGYICVLDKQERINGKLRPQEITRCYFREDPFAVLMRWEKGGDMTTATLYSVELDSKHMFVPGRFLSEIALSSPFVLNSSRYSINEFGIRCGTQRTYKVWKRVKEEGRLVTEYLGREKLPELGERECHVIHRRVDPPEEQGLTDLTVYFDFENWLQVGTVLKAGDDLIGKYYFRDMVLNPTFDPAIFTRDELKKDKTVVLGK